MISFIFFNLILAICINIFSAWLYDSIKEKRYQNAILLIIIEDCNSQSSFLYSPYPNSHHMTARNR